MSSSAWVQLRVSTVGVVSETTRSEAVTTRGVLLSKVPEITVWFWVIKILCTTVGESFADWINMTLGVGLNATALIFTVVLAAVLGCQLRLDRYVPFVYWLTVVVLSVTGTLYTDILTDSWGVPLAVSTSAFAAALAVVFGVWFARERTLSIHSIVTRPRELFYWFAVLVTFALGTAAGDWTLELTGWGPGTSVLLPAGLIVLVVIGWRLGANAVLSFWLAYILTRPLGANLGDWFASPSTEHGLGLGTALTSAIFLAAILATVVYLTRTRGDVIEERDRTHVPAVPPRPGRERIMLGYYAVVAVATGALLVWAAGQPHATAASEEEDGAAPVTTTLTAGEAAAHFGPAETAKFRTITQDTLTSVQAGDQAGARARAKDLETAWDDDESTLRPLDETTWHVVDGRIDSVLKSVRAGKPDAATETQTLTALIAALQ
ncbi:putative membrane-anchored protein [Prescottella agglutinans]|uniref:Membrane-anchored protein n=1 Tax=Prescottella agglutinans TaxID=1644129 RepID=A0ABT6MF74_9NOCA|nr:putative membrane-anchored protein [Prescottella agglutinans]